MIKQLLIIFFILLNYVANSSFAQETVNTTTINKWSVGIQCYSPEKLNPVATGGGGISQDGHYYSGTDLKEKTFFSYGAIVHYNINNNITLRFRAGVNNRKITQYYNTSEGTFNGIALPTNFCDIGTATVKQSAQRFGIGIQRAFHLNNFDAYAGLEFQYTSYSHFTLHYTTLNVRDTITDVSEGNWDIPGGFVIGASPYIGCNLYVMKRISIGAEVAFSYTYMKFGGDAYSDFYTTSPSGGNLVMIQRNSIERIGFDEVKTMLSIAYHFGNKQNKI
ncbi:MAG: hypothetical protein Q7W13_13540 [Bacteroidia bacterium]|nr:hypothetical protein [Bacteroidia bacterium]